MNEGQERFYHFILERVLGEKLEDAKALLNEGFDKQANGGFDGAYAAGYAQKMLSMLKPEHVEEVKAIMQQFGAGRGKA